MEPDKPQRLGPKKASDSANTRSPDFEMPSFERVAAVNPTSAASHTAPNSTPWTSDSGLEPPLFRTTAPTADPLPLSGPPPPRPGRPGNNPMLEAALKRQAAARAVESKPAAITQPSTLAASREGGSSREQTISKGAQANHQKITAAVPPRTAAVKALSAGTSLTVLSLPKQYPTAYRPSLAPRTANNAPAEPSLPSKLRTSEKTQKSVETHSTAQEKAKVPKPAMVVDDWDEQGTSTQKEDDDPEDYQMVLQGLSKLQVGDYTNEVRNPFEISRPTATVVHTSVPRSQPDTKAEKQATHPHALTCTPTADAPSPASISHDALLEQLDVAFPQELAAPHSRPNPSSPGPSAAPPMTPVQSFLPAPVRCNYCYLEFPDEEAFAAHKEILMHRVKAGLFTPDPSYPYDSRPSL